VNKKGVEHFQITLGGKAGEAAQIGKILGPSFAEDDVPDAIETIINLYLGVRRKGETFAACLDRLGIAPFKEALYGKG
jgi:sulfite reductase (NADPH) hemoprotein beta-component